MRASERAKCLGYSLFKILDVSPKFVTLQPENPCTWISFFYSKSLDIDCRYCLKKLLQFAKSGFKFSQTWWDRVQMIQSTQDVILKPEPHV